MTSLALNNGAMDTQQGTSNEYPQHMFLWWNKRKFQYCLRAYMTCHYSHFNIKPSKYTILTQMVLMGWHVIKPELIIIINTFCSFWQKNMHMY